VRAGLDIVDAMAELNAAVRCPPRGRARGADRHRHGPVIVGDQIGKGTASETAVVGETPNLAARLQALAQPNQIVVSSATRSMLGDQFELELLRRKILRGYAPRLLGTRERFEVHHTECRMLLFTNDLTESADQAAGRKPCNCWC
jgi:class 3 adenylate cyclase